MADEKTVNPEQIPGNIESANFQNNISRIITSFVLFQSMIRDTLEYALKRPDHSLQHYNIKKNVILREPQENTPLNDFINRNGENGQNLLTKINKLYEDVYADDSTIITLSQDGKIIVDNAQSLTIIEDAIPLLYEFRNIVDMHIKAAADRNEIENPIPELQLQAERFFTSVTMLTTFSNMTEKFSEFNNIMKEQKGQPGAASNFVTNELGKLFGITENIIKGNTKLNDPLFVAASDGLHAVVEFMTGKRQLPAGDTLQALYERTQTAIREFVSDSETKYRIVYSPCLLDLQNIAKAQREAQTQKSE